MQKKYYYFIIPGALLIIGLGIALFLSLRTISQQKKGMKEVTELMDFEKQQLEQQYTDLSVEMEGYNGKVGNDSLVKLLDVQQEKVQMLLEELRTVKATNAHRILELKNELGSVRKVMMQYVAQIDSLNRLNKALVTENTEVKQKYSEASQTVTQLSKEKESLNEVVSRAAMLEANNIIAQGLTSRNKKTDKISKVETISICYNIVKNVTAKPGEKTIYARITKPDDDVLSKQAGDVFLFENKKIAYSCKKDFEYSGETLQDCLYWNVGETLLPGTYRVDLFVEGRMIGTQLFSFKK
jgi:hypothetical protein